MTHAYQVLRTEVAFSGRVIDVHKDEVAMPGSTTSQRDVVVHPGAVAVVAVDERGVLLVRQYRHPVRRHLDELPAGLLDKTDEPAHLAARRELAEEAGLAAATWHVLLDVLSSAGMTDEAVRIYLARDLSEVDREVQEHEEIEMTTSWRRLDAAADDALAGRLENAVAVAGVLAADRALRTGTGLRPVDAPWPSGKSVP